MVHDLCCRFSHLGWSATLFLRHVSSIDGIVCCLHCCLGLVALPEIFTGKVVWVGRNVITTAAQQLEQDWPQLILVTDTQDETDRVVHVGQEYSCFLNAVFNGSSIIALGYSLRPKVESTPGRSQVSHTTLLVLAPTLQLLYCLVFKGHKQKFRRHVTSPRILFLLLTLIQQSQSLFHGP